LEEKITRLIRTTTTKSTAALAKLQRDFDQVRARAKALQLGAARLEQQQQAVVNDETSATAPVVDPHQQAQLQLQRDVRLYYKCV
jgi:hypothetical protein